MSALHEHGQGCLNGLRRYLVGVGVSVTVAILLQTMALVWWTAAITERVKFLKKGYDGLSTQVHRLETSHGPRS